MLDPSHPLAKLLREDRRYKFEAYAFVFEALNYAHRKLGWGSAPQGDEEGDDEERERHLTGQQLCEAFRLLALEQFGLLAKPVLNSWGVHSTSDIGEIVYNLIGIGQMKKTEEDRRDHFDGVFDFDEGLVQRFEINVRDC